MEQVGRFVRQCAARVMHLDPGPEPRERFTELGMDSLMALQLHGDLAAGLGLHAVLPKTIAFDTGTVEALTRQILRLVDPADGPVQPESRPPRPVMPEMGMPGMVTPEELAGFSDAEVEALLARRVQASRTVAGQ
jgi:hypothetical protein